MSMNILIVASVFSFLLPFLSIFSLGGFIVSMGNNKEVYEIPTEVRPMKL